MRIYIYTDSFPYGTAETFLENEIDDLAKAFDEVVIVPLYQRPKIREMPINVNTWAPILGFNPKDKLALLLSGIFNFSPFFPYLTELFNPKVYKSKKGIWVFFTFFLMFRAIYSNKSLWEKLISETSPGDVQYFYWGDKSVMMAPYLKRKITNKCFARFHRTDLYDYAKAGFIPFRKFVFPALDCLLPISNDGKEYLIQNNPTLQLSAKTIVSRLGVPDRGINPTNVQNEPFHLVSCSYLVPVKRIELLIDALKNITTFEIKWTHIGSGPLHTSLAEKAKLLPANIKVNMLGELTNSQVIQYYKNHQIDLFINVSASEGIPVSIMEALSFGIPVMATNVGGTPEIIDETVGMLLDSTISPQGLATQICNFMNSPDLTDKRTNARNRWNKEFTADKNYSQFVNYFKL